MELKRSAYEELKRWKEAGAEKALLVTGARQIGKTWLIRKFAKEQYASCAEINFITQPEAMRIFAGDLNADTILMNLTAYLGRSLQPGKTLIFLDEIQECPEARTAIKSLVEDGRYDYIASGSLLGVQYKQVKSYPVGYETELTMYPMDFAEFCVANGVQEETFSYLRECWEEAKPTTESVHQTMTELFRYYMVVGGMPEAVRTFVNSRDISAVVRIQADILALYRQDISKYAGDDAIKVKAIFDRIPSELDAKNRRFLLSSIRETARLRDYGESFVWLWDAGVALPCFNVTAPVPPLKINEQDRLFKLFLNDTGLLCAAGMENVQYEILTGNLSVNMGAILENVVAQELKAHGFDLRYLNRGKVGEVDFILQRGSEILPVEVKSGSDYKRHLSLDHALAVGEWKLPRGLVFCRGNIETTGKVTYYPWYLLMFLEQFSMPEKLTVSVNLDGLRGL